MELWDVLGIIAIFISIVSLVLGWRADVASGKLAEELREVRKREADRVDKLIEHLTNRQGGSN